MSLPTMSLPLTMGIGKLQAKNLYVTLLNVHKLAFQGAEFHYPSNRSTVIIHFLLALMISEVYIHYSSVYRQLRNALVEGEDRCNLEECSDDGDMGCL
jgi:hypothetical protein